MHQLQKAKIGETLYYLKVPKCSIHYIEIPEIVQITRIDELTYHSDTLGIDRTIEDLMKLTKRADTNLLVASTEEELKQMFLNYYKQYLFDLKEELSFLEEAVPRLLDTEFLKGISDGNQKQ